jgi:hypothetical protein
MTKGFLFSVVFAVLAATGVQAQKLAITKGQKLETVTTTKMNMEVMGQTIDNESVSTSNVEVKDITADGYLFTNTIMRITMKGSGMGQDMSFDSDKKEDLDGQIGQAVKDKIGAVQEIMVDKQGKVAGIKETEDKKPAGGGMADMMNMTGDIAKGQGYPILIQLPAKPVKAGDTWTDSTGTTATLKTVTTYTLKSVTAEGAIVSFAGTLAKAGTVEQNGMEIQMDMSGTSKGEATYEAASGILRNNATTLDIKGTLGIMGQNAPIAATVISNMTAKKL